MIRAVLLLGVFAPTLLAAQTASSAGEETTQSPPPVVGSIIVIAPEPPPTQDLPLNGRNFIALASLAPGIALPPGSTLLPNLTTQATCAFRSQFLAVAVIASVAQKTLDTFCTRRAFAPKAIVESGSCQSQNCPGASIAGHSMRSDMPPDFAE